MSILSICLSCVLLLLCFLYVYCRESVLIFWLMFMGSVMLSICNSSCVLYSAGYGCEESACCLVWVEDDVVCMSPCMYFI